MLTSFYFHCNYLFLYSGNLTTDTASVVCTILVFFPSGKLPTLKVGLEQPSGTSPCGKSPDGLTSEQKHTDFTKHRLWCIFKAYLVIDAFLLLTIWHIKLFIVVFL